MKFYLPGLAALLFGTAVSLSAAAAISPAEPIEVKAQGVAHDALFAIAFDGANGIAAGAPGKIMNSTDGGKSWSAGKEFPTPLAMLGVDIKGKHAIAVGQMGAVCIRGAEGNWTKVSTPTTERLMNVALHASGLAVAVGAFGTAVKSEDQGKTWQPVTIDFKPFLSADQIDQGIQPHLSAVSIGRDGAITVAGEFSLILRSSDGGASWAALNKGEAAIFALDLRDDGVGYAVGQDRLILRTADHGSSWARITTPSKANLLGVRSLGDRVVVSAMHDMLLSTDGGQGWQSVTTPDVKAGWYSGVGVVGERFMTVGFTGRIIEVKAVQ